MAVNRFSGEEKGVKMSDIARVLNVSKVSVYHGMERLEEKGYIEKNGKKISITPKGKTVLDEYELLIGFLCSHLAQHCGTSEDIAKNDALGAICALSDVSRKGICDFVGKLRNTYDGR